MSETPLSHDLSQRSEPSPRIEQHEPLEQSRQHERADGVDLALRSARAKRAPGLLLRLLGVLIAPVAAFNALVSAPRWLGALAVSAVLVSGTTFVFASSDIGARLIVERRLMFAEAAGRYVSPDQYATLIAREQHGAPLAAALVGAWLVVFTFVVAAAGHAVAHIAMAHGSSSLEALRQTPAHISTPTATATPTRTATPTPTVTPTPPPATAIVRVRFRHAFSIAAHAALIMSIATPCRLLLNVWAGSVGPSTSIGVLLPFLPSDTIWAHLGNAIDLFGLWWALTLATGFAVVYLRRPEGLRLVFIGIYLLAAVVQAAVKALVGAPSF